MRFLIGSMAAFLLCAIAGAEDWTEVERRLESPHPYTAGASPAVTIQAEGARAIRVHFERLDIEEDYDFLDVLDGRGRVVETLTGVRRDFWTRTVTGDRLTLRLRSDEAMEFWGYRVDRYAFTRGLTTPPSDVGPRPPVAPSALARLTCLPATPVVWEGGSTALEILGYDRLGRPVPPESLDLFWNVFGEGEVVRTPVAGRFEYRAPRHLNADAVIRLRVYDAHRPELNADVRVHLRNRASVTGLALLAAFGEVEVGQTVELRIEGRTPAPDARPTLDGWPLRVWLEGPGRLEPLPGVGLYRYVADAGLDIRRPTRVVVHSALVDRPGVTAMTVLTLHPRTNLVGLKVRLSREVVEPGEEIEIRVEGVGDRGDRPVRLRGLDIVMTATVRGSDRHVGSPTRTRVRVGRKPRHPGVWTWRAPERIKRPMEVTIRAAVGDITGKARLKVVRPITSLVVVPAVPRIRAGDTVEIRVQGHTGPPKEVFDLGAGDVTLTLDGPGNLRPGKGKAPFRYEAPKNLARETRVTIRAALRRRPGVRAELRIPVVPDVRVVGIDVACASNRLAPGEETEIRLTPRMSHAGAPAPKDVTLTARAGSLRRVRPGVWAFKAPANVAGRREFVLRAVARDGRGRVTEASVPVLVEKPGTPANAPIDTDHLFVVTEWKTDLPSHAGGGVRPMPKDGIFKPRGGNTTFRCELLKRVRSLHVETRREGKDEVKRFDVGSDNLSLKRAQKGRQTFTFKRQFGHPGQRYTVRVFATTVDGAVYRGTFLVVPK